MFCAADVMLLFMLPALAPTFEIPLLAFEADALIVASFAITWSKESRNGLVPTDISLKDCVTLDAVFLAVSCMSFNFLSACSIASNALLGMVRAAPNAESAIIQKFKSL